MPEENKLETMRHSASHVMAEAVEALFPGVKFGIGPAIEDGFYYDFDLPRTLTMDDLPAIEAKMKEIVAEGVKFERREVSSREALKLFAGQPYKIELINDLGTDKVSSIYSGHVHRPLPRPSCQIRQGYQSIQAYQRGRRLLARR